MSNTTDFDNVYETLISFCDCDFTRFHKFDFDNISSMSTNKSVLSSKFSEGPHGLGDPEDKSLRKVELEVLIPKLIREKAKTEKCVKEVSEFEKCCKDSSLLMVVKCRDQNSALKECLSTWYKNDQFKSLCTDEYLKDRSEYRRTGIKKPIKRA